MNEEEGEGRHRVCATEEHFTHEAEVVVGRGFLKNSKQ